MNPSLDISQYAHKSWKVRDGFFKGSINAIKQTPDGYLWIGTEFGLYRFDGVRMVPWQPGGKEGLPSNVINRVFVSKTGTLWIGTLKGPASWNGIKLTLYPELYGEQADSFAEDTEGTIWIGLERPPAWRLCAVRKGAVQCFGDKGTLGLGIGAVLGDSKGNVWAGTGTGLWRWRTGSPESIPLTPRASEIHSLIEDQNGAVLAATRGGIVRVANGGVAEYRIPDYDQPFVPFGLLRDRDGSLWIGTKARGLLHVHQGSTDHFGSSDGLTSDYVQDLFEDREGSIWIATPSGLDCFRESAASPMSVKQGAPVAGVESILTATDGSVWLGTRNGVDRFQDGRLTLYRTKPAQPPSTLRRIVDPGLPDDFHASIFEDGRGRIWVFSRAGAAYLDKAGHFRRVPGLPGGFAHAIAEDSAGDLWISQDQGFFHLLHGGRVEQIPWTNFGARGVALAIAGDPSSGGLWLGFSRGGVAYFSGGQVRRWYSAAEGLGEGHVHKLLLDPDGTLWAVTEGGLSRFRGDRINTLSSRNGLPCNSVHDFLRDNAESMWLHTACGLVRILRSDLDAWARDPDVKIQTTLLDNSDGFIPSGDRGGLTPRMGKTADGKIWLVTRDGVRVVDPQHLPSTNKIPPPVHIEKIKANGKTYAPVNGLRLPARVRDLAIDYTALSLMLPEKVHFRFKLEEQDSDWREEVNERLVQYSNLPPGAYRFRVTACNNSGVWNETGDTLEFSIAPAYYQTTLFRAGCVAAFLAILWGLYRLRLHQIAREFAAQNEERTRIARVLHDTLLQSFQASLIRMQAARNLLPRRPEDAVLGLNRAIEMAVGAIAEGRDAIQDLRAQPPGGGGLAELLSAAGQEMAHSEDARESPPVFRVMVAGEPRDLEPLLQDEIYGIARELLRNSFRHADAGRIEVDIRYETHYLRVRVRDDGKGIDAEILQAGGRAGHWGMAGMRERANRFGGTLEFWSEAGAGTEAVLTVPAAGAYANSKGGAFSLLRRKDTGA